MENANTSQASSIPGGSEQPTPLYWDGSHSANRPQQLLLQQKFPNCEVRSSQLKRQDGVAYLAVAYGRNMFFTDAAKYPLGGYFPGEEIPENG